MVSQLSNELIKSAFIQIALFILFNKELWFLQQGIYGLRGKQLPVYLCGVNILNNLFPVLNVYVCIWLFMVWLNYKTVKIVLFFSRNLC